jgi:Na+/melibiose symporter-like transporter
MNNQTNLLVRYSYLAFPLAFLGVPLYMHLPKFYHDYYGLNLGSIGLILFCSRLFDAFTDPLLGALSDQYRLTKTRYFAIFAIGLILAFNGFFYPAKNLEQGSGLIWFGLCTIFSYLFFSLLCINYYNLGLYISSQDQSSIQLSSYREFSNFLGMIFASIMPFLLIWQFSDAQMAFRSYGIVFALMLGLAIALLPRCSLPQLATLPGGFFCVNISSIIYILKNPQMKGLLLLFFINSLPVAITSNLIIFYIDQILGAKDSSPLFFLSYFIAAALGSFACSVFFKNHDKAKALLIMMVISSLSFPLIFWLDSSNYHLFYIVCFVSGFGAGAELAILAAIAADLLENQRDCGNRFFSIWNSLAKISLALSAGIFLPLISISEDFLPVISFADKIKFYYGGIPLIIKFIAMIMIGRIKPTSQG